MTSSPPRGRSMCPAEFICDLKRNLGMSPNKHLDGTSCFATPSTPRWVRSARPGRVGVSAVTAEQGKGSYVWCPIARDELDAGPC